MTLKLDKKTMISLRISPRILARLERVANRNGQHLSEFVRLAILRQVERLERGGNRNGA